MSSRPPSTPGRPNSGPPKTKFIQDFGAAGVDLSTAREAIPDNALWWCEGAIPIAAGNVTITNGPSAAVAGWTASIAGETLGGAFMFPFNVNGTDLLFIVFPDSGNGYLGSAAGAGVTKIFNGTLTSGQTAAAQWNNLGLLIIDPTGYWDWGVTVPGVLTSLSNTVQSITMVDPGNGYAVTPGVAIVGGGGAGATATAYLCLGFAAVVAAGTGYNVGDTLRLGVGFPGTSDMLVDVTAITPATGAITGIEVSQNGAIAAAAVNPVNSFGGSGTGATFNVTYSVIVVLLTPGSGYTSAPAVTLTGGGFTRAATATANLSGAINGTSIAVYAGRAWIAKNRTVTFTDVGEYAKFVGSGSEFTIDDSYLHNNITALYAANNYLYIFGDSSIDVLSNVTVNSAGTASFSRVNVSASVGTSANRSIFSHNRSIAFANAAGFWLLSGATPEKISGKLDKLFPTIDTFARPLYGGSVIVNHVMCAAFMFEFTNTFTQASVTSTMMALYFNGKWFFARSAISGSLLTMRAVASIPPGATSGGAGFLYMLSDEPKVYVLFNNFSNAYWSIRTKLFDGGTPMFSKQAGRVAMGCQMRGTQATRAGLTFTVDSETHATGQASTFSAGTFTGYKMLMSNNNEGGGQFLGFGINGTTSTPADISQIQWLALEYSDVTPWPA